MNNEELVFEFLSDYFGDEINEDFNDDDVIDAIYTINELCSVVNEYFEVNEAIEALPDFSSSQIAHRYNRSVKDNEDWPPRPAAKFKAAMRKWMTSKEGKQPTHLDAITTR